MPDIEIANVITQEQLKSELEQRKAALVEIDRQVTEAQNAVQQGAQQSVAIRGAIQQLELLLNLTAGQSTKGE